MNGRAEHGPDTGLRTRPEIFTFAELGSALDTAFELARDGRLHVWDSVRAESQTAGRGQLRRSWHSPPGNIYAALRLPVSPPLDGGAAAAAVGVLAAEALAALGWRVAIKWPNDLVLQAAMGPRKVAGILLEERGGILLAGIGVNVASAPPRAALRADAALEAGCLAREPGPGPVPAAGELWGRLVSHMVSAYTGARIFARTWRERAEALLLWQGREVVVVDGELMMKGRMAGLWPSGGLRLLTESGALECTGGSLRPL